MANDVLIRFSGFQLDPATRTLKFEGRPVALGPKTFDLLVFLALHPHQVVTKEVLLEAMWPDSFVEESNLSQHVFLLRKALGNVGRVEQIVVTVPGKGYQFAATVEQAPRQLANHGHGELLIHAVQSVTRLVVEEEGDDESDDEGPELRQLAAPRKRNEWLRWAVAGAALLVLAGASFMVWRGLRPARAEHIDMVLSDIENSTGDPDFDHTLNEALRIDLEQSPYMNLLSRSRIQWTLGEMQQPKDQKLTPALAREICERNNGQAVLRGTISRLGKRYVFLLNADSCVSGKLIAGYKAEAGSKEEVLAALDLAAGQIRRLLGESSSSLERFQVPIAIVSTSSLEALRAYSEGNQSFSEGDMKTAATLYQSAIQLDPNFASAYKSLSWAYHNNSELERAADSSKKAFDLRGRTNERERLNIEITYYYLGNRDLEAATRSLKLYLAIYPDSAGNLGNLCNLYTQLGQYDAAIEAGERARQMDSNSGFVAEGLARAYEQANRFQEAKAVAAKSIAEGRDRRGTHSILYRIAFAEHAQDRINAEADWGLTHGPKQMALDEMALADATGGKLRQAEYEFAQSREVSLHEGNSEYAEGVQLDLANVYIDLEEPKKASALMNQIHDDPGKPDGLMLVQARLGDFAPAQHYLATMHPEKDANTIHTFRDLPLLRATIALKNHRPAEAVQLLELARPYQLRDFAVPYLRAEAEAEAGMLDAAAADYRLILDNQGVDPISPLYSLSHLRLARVLALKKNTDEASKEYQAFFAAWKNADKDCKLLADAKREYAKLH